ncbi:MAG TPA: hypothetical protein VFS99_02725 [Xanthomonadaceae bacterium]|nr:hypothetical protein [Xanthomonadaceae bacterium]
MPARFHNGSLGHLSIGGSAARILAAAMLLAPAACGDDDDETGTRNGTEANGGQVSGLPAPEGAIGSVTGMPANPGPGTTPMTGTPDATLGDAPATMGGDAADSGLTWIEDPTIEGVFVLTDDPAAGSVAATPVVPTPAPADPSRPVPLGTARATESTTFVAEPAETDDEDTDDED